MEPKQEKEYLQLISEKNNPLKMLLKNGFLFSLGKE